MGQLILSYPALERVDTLMNLLLMVQGFGLLFESLYTHIIQLSILYWIGEPENPKKTPKLPLPLYDDH